MVKTMKMMVTGGGFMYVRGGRTQGEDIASGDLQPRFCAREDFATIVTYYTLCAGVSHPNRNFILLHLFSDSRIADLKNK